MQRVQPIIAVMDDFFQNGLHVRDSILHGSFDGFKNPSDGVTYPGINADISPGVAADFVSTLERTLSQEIVVNALFARAMLGTEKAPHRVHSDKIMCDFSAHVYLSLRWPQGSGTTFWKHDTQGFTHDENTQIDQLDLKSFNGWERYLSVHAKFNRLLVHGAKYWHCAEPTTGWGVHPSDARLVLTCFFNLAKGGM